MHGGVASSMPWAATGWETWPGAAVSFLVMWVVMTAAMMLPSMAPTLWRYREALRSAGETRASVSMALAAGAYLVVWTVLQAVVVGAFAAGQVWLARKG